MSDKTKNWIFIGAFIILLVGVFFAGRSCGSNQQRQIVRDVKAQLASSIEGQRKLRDALGREREYVRNLESINRRLISGVEGLEESIDIGYRKLEERFAEQLRLIEELANLNSRLRDVNKSIGDRLRESIDILDKLDKSTEEPNN
jgi:uncharacterized coiled-coil protein SlyX